MPQPLRYLLKAAGLVRQRNLRHAIGLCALATRSNLMSLADRMREAPFGISTEGVIQLRDLVIVSDNRAVGFPYVPSPGLLVDTLLFNVNEDLSRFSFADFGSGKGRALLVAARYPFREVVGVEFAPELHEVAQANIRKYTAPARQVKDVRSICADAATFPIPANDCVLYFNNPFAEPVFDQVLDNIQAAHERRRPKLYVLYQQLAGDLENDRAENIAALQRAPFLRERQVQYPSAIARFLLASYDLRVFESVP
jgi:SAM-dependent methyltransferase